MATINYSQQEMIKELDIPKAITVVGTGAVGAWVAIFAAMAGVPRLILFGGLAKYVDETDLAHLPYSPEDIGTLKVEAVRRLILQLRPDADVTAHINFELDKHADMVEGVVVCAASSTLIMHGLGQLAADRKLRYVTGAYHGLDIGVFAFPPRNLKLSTEPGAVWVGSAAFIAALMLSSAFVEPLNFIGQVSQLDMKARVVERRLGITLGDSPTL